jgi:hypothetical protein
MTFTPDKKRMKDSNGRYIVQGLFIQDKYNTHTAQYSWTEEDVVKDGVTYPSLMRLFLDYKDVKEYAFAKEYLYSWTHWKRLKANKLVGDRIAGWIEELELSLEAEGVMTMVDLAEREEPSYQAAKYLADRGWDKKGRGRPSKDEVQSHLEAAADVAKEYEEDFKLFDIKGK